MGLGNSLKHAWNAFSRQPATEGDFTSDFMNGFTTSPGRPDRPLFSIKNDRTIVAAIYNRLAVDFSGVEMRHVRTDKDGRYASEMTSGLNECLKLRANIDQGARAFRQDIAMTLCEEGTIAIFAVDTTEDPEKPGSWDVNSLRVGKVVKWMPRHVKISVYDDRPGFGKKRNLVVEKRFVAIVENPFYTVMNEPSSTLQRLIRKLNLLDAVDEASASGKLDLIIQLPYVVKSETRRAQANKRREEIEFQLKGSKYGVAYTDGTEKITQLNRPVENQLMDQIEYLVNMLYGQLGLTPEIMNGTADEKAMLNYQTRTIEPFLDAVREAMEWVFITKTGRTQGQSIMYFRDPFKLVPISSIAEIADKFTRNEILTANEIRSSIGYKPSTDAKADELRNSNMPLPSEAAIPVETSTQEGDRQNGT